MGDNLAGAAFGCLAAIVAQAQFNICNTRSYGTDSTCADNCCRFNCGWKQGALPVEDYPIANSQAQREEGKAESEAPLPAYDATPQMSVTPPPPAAAAGPTAAEPPSVADAK